jgi:hypothetical protein
MMLLQYLYRLAPDRAERLVFLSDGRVFCLGVVSALTGGRLEPAPVQLLQTGQAYNLKRAAADHERAVHFWQARHPNLHRVELNFEIIPADLQDVPFSHLVGNAPRGQRTAEP